jgi:hypothetical protein
MRIAKHIVKLILWRFAPNVFRKIVTIPEQEFSIAICRGDRPWSVDSALRAPAPVLTRRSVRDVPAAFVADPFMLKVAGRWHMFFEVMNSLRHKGEIGLATSDNGVDWQYQKIVLAEPFHLSYPYVFEWEGDFYLIPEACEGGGIRLYKAAEFPFRWSCVGKLLEEGPYLDSSIFRFQDRWWLYTASPAQDRCPTLRLYHSSELLGGWQEHPASPIVSHNFHIARPGGRVTLVGGRPIRFAQDVYPVYGSQVWAFEVLELTPTSYAERQLGSHPILKAGEHDWNNGGMHHVDLHLMSTGTWIACVDGFSAGAARQAATKDI